MTAERAWLPALLILAIFGALHLAGARADVGVLSGSIASVPQLASGLAYAGAYFGALLLVPPLLATALMARALRRTA